MSKIEEYRLRQPISELERKAQKAICLKTKLWTQEEIDLARVKARKIRELLKWY